MAFYGQTTQACSVSTGNHSAVFQSGDLVSPYSDLYPPLWAAGLLTVSAVVAPNPGGLPLAVSVVSLTGSPSVGQSIVFDGTKFIPSNTAGIPNDVLPQNWRNCWDAALASQAVTPAHVTNIGDSVSDSAANSNKMTGGWFETWRTAILARTGNSLFGDYYAAWPITPGFGGTFTGSPYGTPGSAGSAYEMGLGRAVGPGTATAAWWLSYTPTYAPTGIDIIFTDLNAGTWQFDLNGASVAGVTATGVGVTVTPSGTLWTVTNAGAGSYAQGTLRKIKIRGLTGTPVIRVGQQSASDVLQMNGIVQLTGNTGGIFFSRIAHSGENAVDWSTWRGATNGAGGLPSAPSSKHDLLSGKFSALNASPYGIQASPFGHPTAPHLTFSGDGINDAANAVPLNPFAMALRRRYQALRAGQDNASICQMIFSSPDSQVSDDVYAGRGPTYARYKERSMAMAKSFGAAVIDIDSAWGDLGVAKGFQNNGNLHPTPAGDLDIAARVLAVT